MTSPLTPASADMTEQGDKRAIIAIAKALTELVMRAISNKPVDLLSEAQNIHALASARADHIADVRNMVATTPAAETGGGQLVDEAEASINGYVSEWLKDTRANKPSPDDADARGEAAWQAWKAHDLGDGCAHYIALMEALEAARLRTTTPPSEDDKKARELANEIEGAAKEWRTFEGADRLRNTILRYLSLSLADIDLILSRLRSKPSPDPLLAELRELFEDGGWTVVSWKRVHDHQTLLRTKELTDAQRAAIHFAMSGGGGAEVSEEA